MKCMHCDEEMESECCSKRFCAYHLDQHLGGSGTLHADLPELKAVDIQPYETSVNQLTVELLEEMLADAKSGKIQEAVVVGFLENGDTASAYTPTVNFIRRLGAIELVKLRWMHHDILHDGQTPEKS